MFAARCMMQKTPIRFNAFVYVVSNLVLAQALRIFEAPVYRVTFQKDHSQMKNCL